MASGMSCLDGMNLEEFSTDGYGTHIVSQLKQFRDDGLFCDFTLVVGNETFKVHKVVLAGCSDYFRAMFSHGMVESNKDQLELKSVPTAGIGPLIEYAYTGKMYLNLDIVPDILAVATFLQITSALKLCSEFLKAKMTFANADNLVSLGENFGMTELKEYRRKKILENFVDFANTDQFLQVDVQTLCDYLMDDNLKAKTEAKVLCCALKWYNYDRTTREAVVHEVLDKVRYTLDGWPTIDFAMNNDPFKNNKKCQKILARAEEYMKNATRKHLNVTYRTRVRYGKKTLVQMGGMRRYKPTPLLGFELPDEPPEEEEEKEGGCGKNYYYHHEYEQWCPLGLLGNGDSRSHNPLVVVNDNAILVGGYLYTSDFVRSYQHCSNEVKLFTPAGFALWDLPYLHEPRAHHVAVHTPGFIYAVGGKNESGPLRIVEQFHLEDAVWGIVCPLEFGLYDHAGAAYKEFVYISGGVENERVINNVRYYNPHDDEWLEKAPMLQARAGHSMALFCEQLVVCGGKSNLETGRCLSSVESYSLEIGQWSFLTPMRLDCAHMTPVVLEDKLLICGGENSVGNLLAQIQQYDPKQKSWSKYGELPIAMRNAGICAVTIKMNETGEEDRDSLFEAYNRRWDSDEEYFDDEEDEEEEIEEFEDWRDNVQRNGWM